MEQNTKNLVWINIITIFIGAIASFLLYFFGWVASITSFITMYVLILIYIKYCKKLPSKKILVGLIITVCLTHILSIVFSLFVTTAIANKISLAAAFALVASTFVSYVIVLALSITLTIAMSLFGTLSAYQFLGKE